MTSNSQVCGSTSDVRNSLGRYLRKIAWESGNGFFVGDTVLEKIGDYTFFLPFKEIEYDAILPYGLRCYQDSTLFYKAVDMPCDSITLLESSNLPHVHPV